MSTPTEEAAVTTTGAGTGEKSRKSRVALGVIGGLIGGVACAVLVQQGLNGWSLFSMSSSSHTSEAVAALERTEEVALLSLGIEGITSKSQSLEVLGVSIPGSGKTAWIKHSYTAKLGIDGKDVIITPEGESVVRISIPEFIVIGAENPEIDTVVEDNGVLSLVTQDVDTAQVATTLLSSENLAQHIDSYRDLLEDQAEDFYSSIVAGIDPELVVVVDFAD